MSTDRIEKSILLHAPLGKVWRAISDSAEFGTWFGMKLDGPFVPGAPIRGYVLPNTVNAKVAASQKKYEGTPVEMNIEQIEPECLFSFRWHPYALDPAVDYSAEPTTLIVFALEEVADGVRLTITESGFDQIPIERRAGAFKANDGGWAMMVNMIAEYLAL